ncbi:hypothetical protein FA95DRAFT_1037194 [Auriscalpium vulgare]|uniref:Uncharacterized protein n=1 Tax=Auriscalpium vulgare TaxID=40419 RepID=A0ACB8RW06_9AGAM|nr:hypothetical protein FA95DRAFT_1037194 [Auriscalpium vulgare]
MAAPATSEMLQRLRDSIVRKPPYESGTLPVTPKDLILYFGKDTSAQCVPRHMSIPLRAHHPQSRIDFTTPSAAQLGELAKACDRASFGLNSADVIDENYRKAGKLDAEHFATLLATERLVEIVHNQLLEGEAAQRPLKLELYKLNVYGEGSFFKSHKDTPRGESMFGSLVVTLPTPHAGGALVLRHGGEEWTVDAATALAEAPAPSVAFVTFFSDVEHEVLPVTSGHRVTLTYNLSYGDILSPAGPPADPIPPIAPSVGEVSFRTALEALLADPEFLKYGGKLGFGLRHVYPVHQQVLKGSTWKHGRLDHVYKLLKGPDALVHRVCTALQLRVKLCLAYRDYYEDDYREDVVEEEAEDVKDEDKKDGLFGVDIGGVALVLVPDIPDVELLDGSLAERLGGKLANHPKPSRVKIDHHVQWVTEPKSLTKHATPVIAYGNQAQLDWEYADLCLIVSVGKADRRSEMPEDSDSEEGRVDSDDSD